MEPTATTDSRLNDETATGQAEETLSRQVVVVAGLAFVAMLPVTMLVPALKELVSDRFDVGRMQSHAFMSVNMIGAIVMAPLLTNLSNRRGFMSRVAAAGLAVDAMLLALMSVAPTSVALLGLRFFEGAAHILAISTLMGMASMWGSSGTRGRTMGVVGAAMMFGTACGTGLGGFVWRHWPGAVFTTAAWLAGVAALMSILLVREAPMDGLVRRPDRGSMWALFGAKSHLWVAYIYAFIDRFCVGVIISTFVLFLADVHGLDPSMRGRLLVMFMLPFAALVFPAGRLVDRIGRVWPIAVGSILFGVAFATYGYLPLAMLKVMVIVSGVLSALMFAPNLALCADLSPDEHRGAAFTAFNIAGSLGFLIGPLAGGLMLQVFTGPFPQAQAYALTLALTGATEVACGLLTLPLLLRLRRAGVTR